LLFSNLVTERDALSVSALSFSSSGHCLQSKAWLPLALYFENCSFALLRFESSLPIASERVAALFVSFVWIA
jgi:hypothetical protein